MLHCRWIAFYGAISLMAEVERSRITFPRGASTSAALQPLRTSFSVTSTIRPMRLRII